MPADLPTMGRLASTAVHWFAVNSYFPYRRVFIASFSELLGINIEGLNSLLLGIQLFIQIYFDGVWKGSFSIDLALAAFANLQLQLYDLESSESLCWQQAFEASSSSQLPRLFSHSNLLVVTTQHSAKNLFWQSYEVCTIESKTNRSFASLWSRTNTF